MRSWLKVFLASILEVFWVIGLAYADEAWEWIGTIIVLLICNYFFIKATSELPTGTVYTVFVGLGTAGAVLSEILFFDEPFNLMKIILIAVLLIGVIGLKQVTDHEGQKGEEDEWNGSH